MGPRSFRGWKHNVPVGSQEGRRRRRMEGGGGKEGRRPHRLNDEHGYRLQDECIGCKVTCRMWGHGSLVYITVSPATCNIYQGDLQYRQHVYLS